MDQQTKEDRGREQKRERERGEERERERERGEWDNVALGRENSTEGARAISAPRGN